MSSEAPPERDLRLSLFYGAALLFIFIDHLRLEPLAWMGTRDYGFSDSTEIFIFLSGCAAALFTDASFDNNSPIVASVRVLRSAWRIYFAHLLLFAVYAAEIGYVAVAFENPLYNEEMAIIDLMNHPNVTLIQALLLKLKPANFDILPLYILLLAGFSSILPLLQRSPNVVFGCSALLYFVTCYFRSNLPAYPAGTWLLSPLAWQFLFVAGAWCSLGGARRLDVLTKSRLIVVLAIGYLVFALVLTQMWHIPKIGPYPYSTILPRWAAKLMSIDLTKTWYIPPLRVYLPNWIVDMTSPVERTYLGPLRLSHFLALAVVAMRLVPRDWEPLQSATLRPIMLCGQHPLELFCLAIFLSFIGNFVFVELSHNVYIQFFICLVGISIMLLIAVILASLEALIPRQVLRDRSIALARQMAKEHNLANLDTIAAGLPTERTGLFADNRVLRDVIFQIARQQRGLDTVQRPFFREPLARALRNEIDTFRRLLIGLNTPVAEEFLAAARQWRLIADSQLKQAQAVVTKTPTPQVFRAGDPVDRNQEAFVPRLGLIADLEGQLMLATGCPGLLLYGRRRTGKSTTLKNLAGFLPPEVQIKIISMQNPDAFTSIGSFTKLVARSVGVASSAELAHFPELNLSDLYTILDNANNQLDRQNQRLLLAIDEYENLDAKMDAGVFPADLLSTLRESIQMHRRITWVFAGSHDVTELRNASWSSYLVSARTLEVPLFSAQETRLLLTEPLRYSSYWQSEDLNQPRFFPEVWGASGIEYIHGQAAGWPHLVQLIAETIVDLLNDSSAKEADRSLLDHALDLAIVRGDLVLRQLVQHECVVSGEWEYVSGFRWHETQPPPGDILIQESLRRRLMVVEEGDVWRLRVPLMQRWLRVRG